MSEVIDRNDGAVKVDEYFDIGLVTEFRCLLSSLNRSLFLNVSKVFSKDCLGD